MPVGGIVEAKNVSRQLAHDSIAGLREILAFVLASGDTKPSDIVHDLSHCLRLTKKEIREVAQDPEDRIQQAVIARYQHARPVAASATASRYTEGKVV